MQFQVGVILPQKLKFYLVKIGRATFAVQYKFVLWSTIVLKSQLIFVTSTVRIILAA